MAVKHILICDKEGCKNVFGPADNKNELLRRASKNNWELNASADGGFFCPSCTIRPPEPEENEEEEEDMEHPFATEEPPWKD